MDALRKRYAPLVGEKDAKDYYEVYGADERRAAGDPAAMVAVSQTLRSAAAELTNQPDLRRYVLLRAFVAARAGGAPVDTLDGIVRDLEPLLKDATPAVQAQRAELHSALADAALAATKTPGAAASPAGGAAQANFELAMWQLNHNYLPQAAGSLARCERYARLVNLKDVVDACGDVRKVMADRSAARERYMKLATTVSENPGDPKAHTELAMFLLTSMRDVSSAAGPAGKSDDPQLRALAGALIGGDAGERNADVGLALAALADRSGGADRGALAALAIEYLDAFVKGSTPAHPSYTKARLYSSRLRQLALEASQDRVVTIPAPPSVAAEGGGVRSNIAPSVRKPSFLATDARRVAYVLDSSGSMLNLFGILRTHVRKAVDALQPDQAFDIIFFSEDRYKALDRQLLLAVPENKRKAYDFLETTSPHGSTDPIPSLQLAFKAQPQLIYFLTDGEFNNNAAIIEEIRKLNKDGRVKINTIAFGNDASESFHKFLRQIAQENGGTFQRISEADAAAR